MLRKERQQALELFVQGRTIPEISQDLSIKLSTVKSWHHKDQWQEKREEFNKKKTQALYFRLISQIEQSCQKYLQGSILVGHIATEQIQLLYQEFKAGEKFDLSSFERLTVCLAKGASIHKQVVPDANEQLSNQILQELKEIRNFHHEFNESESQ